MLQAVNSSNIKQTQAWYQAKKIKIYRG